MRFPYCILTDFTKFFFWQSTLLDFGFLTEKASSIQRIQHFVQKIVFSLMVWIKLRRYSAKNQKMLRRLAENLWKSPKIFGQSFSEKFSEIFKEIFSLRRKHWCVKMKILIRCNKLYRFFHKNFQSMYIDVKKFSSLLYTYKRF